MAGTITVKTEEWKALEDRCLRAEEKARVEEGLRKSVTEELGKLQRRYAKLLTSVSATADEASATRLRYLLQSDIVRLYDEQDADGNHRFNRHGLDACLLYAFEKTFDKGVE